jgi:ribose transport system substrate-binding protein
MLKGQWTQESAQKAVRSWLKLSTSQKTAIDLISAQDDSMAMGARDAFKELANEDERERWLKLPYTGCDGLPKTGQAWVKSGLLAATVFVPPNAGQAIETLFDAIQNKKMPAERVMTAPTSIPPLTALGPKKS